MKSTLSKLKVRKITMGEIQQTGAGVEPTWKDLDQLSDQEYMTKTSRAIGWYYKFYSRKEGQEYLEAWLHNRFPKRRADVKLVAAAKSDYATNLLCALYPMELQGWKPRFAIMRHIAKDLKVIIANGRERKQSNDKAVETAVKSEVPQQTIQEKVREQAGAMCEELDYAIDNFITDPDGFDPKAFKVVNLLRNKGVKPAHARYIKTIFDRGFSEVKELASGKADDQLREAYKHHPRKNVRKLIEFYESIETACDQIIGEAKVLKKPRAKKVKPVEDLVKKIKFLATDDKLGIASVSPTQIVGSQGVIVFNVKTRKLGYYTAKSVNGFAIKGASLDNFSEKSIQKTLRKPAEQLKALKEQNTQRRFETWFNKEITTTDTLLNGRLNEDTLIIKVFK